MVTMYMINIKVNEYSDTIIKIFLMTGMFSDSEKNSLHSFWKILKTFKLCLTVTSSSAAASIS